MSYQPNVYLRPIGPPRRGRIAPPIPLPRGARRVGLGDLGASGVQVAQAVVSQVPVVGSILSNFVGPIAGLIDPGAKRDAGRKQRAQGISEFANEGSLLAARQLYGAAEKGAVGAAAEKALYVPLWQTFQANHADIATAAKLAGAAGVGPDPVNGWQPPAADVAQYSSEIAAYQQHGVLATAQQAAGARAGVSGSTLGIVAALGIGLALLRSSRR